MGELVRKELKSFFASLSGYVVLVFFLLANGLFLWIIPGGYHIPASGLADMQAFFTLAPLLYFFWFLLFVCAYLQKKGVPVRWSYCLPAR